MAIVLRLAETISSKRYKRSDATLAGQRAVHFRVLVAVIAVVTTAACVAFIVIAYLS